MITILVLDICSNMIASADQNALSQVVHVSTFADRLHGMVVAMDKFLARQGNAGQQPKTRLKSEQPSSKFSKAIQGASVAKEPAKLARLVTLLRGPNPKVDPQDPSAAGAPESEADDSRVPPACKAEGFTEDDILYRFVSQLAFGNHGSKGIIRPIFTYIFFFQLSHLIVLEQRKDVNALALTLEHL